MNHIALAQFDSSARLLLIDLVALERRLVSEASVNPRRICFGFFEVESEAPALTTVALFATPKGPVLLLNDLLYPMSLGKTKIRLSDIEKKTHFRLLHEDQHVFEMWIEPKFGIGLHPYNNEREDIDFYFWLSKQVDNPAFYSTYTKEMVYADPEAP